MADALDGAVSGAAVAAGAAGVAAAGAAGAGAARPVPADRWHGLAGAAAVGATAMSGVARANPKAVPYAPTPMPPPTMRDRRATAAPSGATEPPIMPPEDETSPVVWIAGIVAVVLLGADRLPRLPARPAVARAAVRVARRRSSVPNFVGQLVDRRPARGRPTWASARHDRRAVGPAGRHDPGPGPARRDRRRRPAARSTSRSRPGVDTTPVPDIRNLPESDALQAIVDAGLRVGARTEAFDPIDPGRDASIARARRRASIVAKRTPVDYVVSKGPEPTPSPTPDADPDADADTHADPDADTDAHADADTHADPDPDADTDADPDRRRRRRPDPAIGPAIAARL